VGRDDNIGSHHPSRNDYRGEERRVVSVPREPRESPETLEEEPERPGPHSATGEAQEGVRRPWWRRLFGA
jgi:hypothetical protein